MFRWFGLTVMAGLVPRDAVLGAACFRSDQPAQGTMDGQTLATQLIDQPIDLTAGLDTLMAGDCVTPVSNTTNDGF